MFANRLEAGCQLGRRLEHLSGQSVMVLGLPRGGVIVAAQIAEALSAPLDVLVVRKLGAPLQPELAIGAVTDGDQPQQIFNDELIDRLAVSREYLDREIQWQLAEVRRRQELYRGGRPAVKILQQTVIVADDGIATGATVRAGIQALRGNGAARIVLAVPVAPLQVAQSLRQEVDELLCLQTPASFTAVGAFYGDFRQVTDKEVIDTLQRAAQRRHEGCPPS
ncbi:MAG: phosphoribosyltransferase [Planctomycetes bacterium]|nr:phosphoribosyltransferase [Planctomycetota bacterium]